MSNRPVMPRREMERKIHAGDDHENNRDEFNLGAVKIPNRRIMSGEPTDCDRRKRMGQRVNKLRHVAHMRQGELCRSHWHARHAHTAARNRVAPLQDEEAWRYTVIRGGAGVYVHRTEKRRLAP